MTLYINKNDTATTSACTDTCAQNWPPLVAASGQTATLEQSLSEQLGTLTRADGSTQVTYNGMPLYYFNGDHNPGDTNGQGNGGIWSVVVLGGSSGSATPAAPGANTTTTP